MKKTMNNLDSLISRAITETLEEKAKHITTKLNELGGMEDGHPKFGKMNFASMSDEEIDDLMSSVMDDEYMDYDGDDASTLPGTNYGDDDEFEMDDSSELNVYNKNGESINKFTVFLCPNKSYVLISTSYESAYGSVTGKEIKSSIGPLNV